MSGNKDMGADSRLSQAEPQLGPAGFDPARGRATPYSFCWTDTWSHETLKERALELAKSMASVKCKNKYPVGVIGAEARAHYVEARRIARAAPICARKAKSPHMWRTPFSCWLLGHKWHQFHMGAPDGPVILECGRCRYIRLPAIATETRRAETTGSVEDEGAAIAQDGDA